MWSAQQSLYHKIDLCLTTGNLEICLFGPIHPQLNIKLRRGLQSPTLLLLPIPTPHSESHVLSSPCPLLHGYCEFSAPVLMAYPRCLTGSTWSSSPSQQISHTAAFSSTSHTLSTALCTQAFLCSLYNTPQGTSRKPLSGPVILDICTGLKSNSSAFFFLDFFSHFSSPYFQLPIFHLLEFSFAKSFFPAQAFRVRFNNTRLNALILSFLKSHQFNLLTFKNSLT